MTEQDQEDQFLEVKPLVEAMFDLSSSFVSNLGNFLPHGGVLDLDGQVSFCAAAPENDLTNSEEVLPLLHEALRLQTGQFVTTAVAVSESVFIGEDMRPAIKVLVEHRRGVSLALYQPWKKRLFRGPKLGDVVMQPADPEVGGWTLPAI